MWFISIVTYDEYSSIIVLINMTRFQECAPNIKHIFLWIWSSKHGRISMLSTWFVSSDFKCPVIRTALYINKGKSQYILAKQFPTESRLTLFNTAFSFPNGKKAENMLLLLSRFSGVRLCATDPIDSSPPGSPVLGFSRQEHWSGLPFPSPVHESEKWKRDTDV